MSFNISIESFNKLIKLIRHNFLNIYRLIYQLDPLSADLFKSKNQHYHSLKPSHKNIENEGAQCCSGFFGKIYIPIPDQSPLENHIYELLLPSSLRVILPKILDNIGSVFFKVKNKGIKDGLKWDIETEKQVLFEVCKEGFQRELIKELKIKLQADQKCFSKQPGLLAQPQSWLNKFSKDRLDRLHSQTIIDLLDKGFSIQKNFIGNKESVLGLYSELNYLEKEAKFEEFINEENMRTDRALNITLSDMNDKLFPFLNNIGFNLASLAYELNSKNTGLLLQVSESFQISYFNDRGAYHRLHIDSSLDKKFDTGKSLTILYFCNIDEEKDLQNKIILKDHNDIYYEIETILDSILIIKSRKISYEIKENFNKKRFIVRFWINGPADIKNNSF